jgi:hypothetical protein
VEVVRRCVEGAGGMGEMQAAMEGGYNKVARPAPAAPGPGAGMYGEE